MPDSQVLTHVQNLESAHSHHECWKRETATCGLNERVGCICKCACCDDRKVDCSDLSNFDDTGVPTILK